MTAYQTETFLKQEHRKEVEKVAKLLDLVDEKQKERLNNFLDAGIFLASRQQSKSIA